MHIWDSKRMMGFLCLFILLSKIIGAIISKLLIGWKNISQLAICILHLQKQNHTGVLVNIIVSCKELWYMFILYIFSDKYHKRHYLLNISISFYMFWGVCHFKNYLISFKI